MNLFTDTDEIKWNPKERWLIDQIWNGDPDTPVWKIREQANHLFPGLKTRYEETSDD